MGEPHDPEDIDRWHDDGGREPPGEAVRPGGTPEATADGRPFVLEGKPDDKLPLWLPEPAREGDPVYCRGVLLGTFHGDRTKPGGWYVRHRRLRELPAELADAIRARRIDAPR